MADGIRRSAILNRLCTEIGRDPAEVVRSTNVPASYGSPDDTRTGINQALDAGFRHIVLTLPAPYPDHVAHWVTDQHHPYNLNAAGHIDPSTLVDSPNDRVLRTGQMKGPRSTQT